MARTKTEAKTETPGDADTPVLQIPGDEGGAQYSVEIGAPESAEDLSVKLAAAQLQITQLEAALELVNSQLQNAQTVAAPLVQVEGPRLIGEDWSNKTSAQARAAGVKSPVLCSDGYYVPGA